MSTQLLVPRRPVRRARPSRFDSGFGLNWQRDLDRLFGDLAVPNAARSDFAPAVDVENGDGEIRLTAELPGLEEKDFEVLVEQSVLTLKGEKRAERSTEEAGFRRFERTTGSFERRFDLGWDVDPDDVKASYKHGVLQIVIPKPVEQNSARTIPVTTRES